MSETDRPHWGIRPRPNPERAREVDTRLAVLDSPPLHVPWRGDLSTITIRDDALSRNLKDWEVFEEISLEHAQTLLPALRDLQLCERNALSIDFHTPESTTLVGQVKSGRITGRPVLDQTLGAATLPGAGADRQHVFVYSEAGFRQGAYGHADERGLFLWHIDYCGRVLPWSASARWLCSQAEVLGHASLDETRNILNEAAWQESADRSAARDWLVELSISMWEDVYGPLRSEDRGYTGFLRNALETAESLQGAREMAHEILQRFDLALSPPHQDSFQDPGWPPPGAISPNVLYEWRDAYFEGDRNRHLWKLCWIANGAGSPTEEKLDWPDLDDDEMDVLYAWNDNVWDGGTEHYASRFEEMRAVNRRRREIGRNALAEAQRRLQGTNRAAAGALGALNRGWYQCPKCLDRNNVLDAKDFQEAPRLITAERVWAAILRGEPAPPDLYAGFSQSDDYAYLFWE